MAFENTLPFIIQNAIALFVLSIGSYTDLKTREVPDWINLGLVGMGFGLNALFSIIYWKVDFVLASAAGFSIFFALALLMFYTGQWGGGDSKILMGLGSIIGIDFLSKNFFLFNFLINMLVVGAFYGFLWSFGLILKNQKKFMKELKALLRAKTIKSSRNIFITVFFVLILTAILVKDDFLRIVFFYFGLAFLLTFYLWIIIKAVENSCMLKYVKPVELTEGDWIARDVKIDGKYITGPKDLGIEKKKIRKLIGLYKKRKIRNVLIKIGIPFVPSFFIAYLVTLIYGNLVFLII